MTYYHLILKNARETVNQIEFLIKDLAVKALSQPHAIIGLVVGHMWICPEWPGGVCVYERWADPAHDECLFCGLPQERK
ncbi:hypothetical protein KAR91_09765 [Candidatus Pacearchaeota archaeon]|nr:hypothetical protein [Candidatus Pacearchaeota archaeon]